MLNHFGLISATCHLGPPVSLGSQLAEHGRRTQEKSNYRGKYHREDWRKRVFNREQVIPLSASRSTIGTSRKIPFRKIDN
jgi:hypothetical protein